MLKNTILILFLINCYQARSQEFHYQLDEDQKAYYAGEFVLDGMDMKNVFGKASEWINRNFTTRYDSIIHKDAKEGRLTARGGIRVTYIQDAKVKDGGIFSYKINFEIENNILSYKIEDIVHAVNPNGPECGNMGREKGDCNFLWRGKTWRILKEEGDEKFVRLISSLESSVR